MQLEVVIINVLCFQDPVLPDETVIVIRSLVPGGAAEQDGRLHPGHRLMSVNDTNLEHATLDMAVQTLKSTKQGIVIYLRITFNLLQHQKHYTCPNLLTVYLVLVVNLVCRNDNL
jgi:hypothetical protein